MAVSAGDAHPLEHECHRHEAVADEHHPRIDHAAVPLTAEHRARGEHRIDDIRLANRRDMTCRAVPRGDQRRHPTRRAVDHDRPGAFRQWGLRQHRLDGQRERRLLADVSPLGRGNRQPVGIGILEEADICVLKHDSGQHIGKVVGRRLRRVLKAAVGLAPLDHDLAAEMLEQRPGHAAARTVARVEPDSRPAAADRLHVDRLRDERDVGRTAVDQANGARLHGGLSGRVCRGGLRPKSLEYHGPGCCREHATRRGKKLEAVVGGGVVAGGDLDAAGGPLVSHDDPHGGRGCNPAVDHVAARSREVFRDCRRQQRPGCAAVATDHDRPGGQRASEGGDIANGHLGREAAADDATESGDADDQEVARWFTAGFTHGS